MFPIQTSLSVPECMPRTDDSLTLPTQAVVQSGNQPYVLVVDSTHHVERRNVTLGIETANRLEILSGLHDGEHVIASGQTEYEPGEVVTPRAAFIPTVAQEMGN